MFSQEHGGQRRRAGLRKRITVERDLHARVAHLRAEVLAVERRQPPTDVQPQPEQRRQLGVGEIGVQVVGYVEERLLEDVRGVEPGPHTRVDAQLDHATEPIAVASEQGRQCLAITSTKSLDQVGRFAGRVLHDGPHTPYPRRAKARTEKVQIRPAG